MAIHTDELARWLEEQELYRRGQWDQQVLPDDSGQKLNDPGGRAGYGGKPFQPLESMPRASSRPGASLAVGALAAPMALKGGQVPLSDIDIRSALKNPAGYGKLALKNIGSEIAAHPGAAFTAGGAALGGLMGGWMEDLAGNKDSANRKWQEGQSKFAVRPEAIGADLDAALESISQRKAADTTPAIRKTGRASLLAAKAKMGGNASTEVKMGVQALQAVESMANKARAVGLELNRRRETRVSSNIAALGGRQTKAGLRSAEFLRAQSQRAYQMTKAEGDAWRDAINGMAKMATFVVTAGASGPLEAAAASGAAATSAAGDFY